MFKKILIVEDIDSINLGIRTILAANINADIRSTKYCDEAYLKIKRAILEESPFELIITDLSFKEDHRDVKIKSGEELINTINLEQPDVPIIVYSIEDRPFRIKSLFKNYKINAYVGKSRESAVDLIEAVKNCYQSDSTYISPHLMHIVKDPSFLEIEDYDVDLLKHLANGLTQIEISEAFKQEGINSSSISSIEKRINKLKIFLKANNTIHLIAIAKDFGII